MTETAKLREFLTGALAEHRKNRQACYLPPYAPTFTLTYSEEEETNGGLARVTHNIRYELDMAKLLLELEDR